MKEVYKKSSCVLSVGEHVVLCFDDKKFPAVIVPYNSISCYECPLAYREDTTWCMAWKGSKDPEELCFRYMEEDIE